MTGRALEPLVRLLRAYLDAKRRHLTDHYRAVYDRLNVKTFGGTLPACTIRVVDGWCTFPNAATGDHYTQGIKVSDWWAAENRTTRQIEQLLLHEVCHLRGAAGHGDDFRAELRRLAADARAPWVTAWVKAEITRCQRRERAERRELERARAGDRKRA